MHPETKIELIQGRIHVIRGQRVMLDMDLAELYDIDTKTLKRAVRRNTLRFPSDFMFELTLDELGSLRYQIGTLKRGQHVKYQPFAFTEQGVAMLSSVLRSERAIYMNIAIMRAFIAVRRMANEHREILEQLAVLTERVGSHDKQLASIYEAIENLLDDKADQQSWVDRERIGFRTSGKNQDKS